MPYLNDDPVSPPPTGVQLNPLVVVGVVAAIWFGLGLGGKRRSLW